MKYHGKKNRGVTNINFFDEAKRDLNDVSDLDYCGNEWKFPTSCSLEVQQIFKLSYTLLAAATIASKSSVFEGDAMERKIV